MPAGSEGFRSLLKEVPKDISDKMYRDKKLLDAFSNFYQSYLLLQSGVIDADQLKYYIKEFPLEFSREKIKEKYPDNAFIQAIKMNISKKSGNPFLTIKITGIDEPQKESLRSAWIDLHKQDPELSRKLFYYSFFVAGIGFSPKTFMSLVPTYVKERIHNDNGASYVDTYRNFPTIPSKQRVIDQFVRNNWNNNKLVPKRGDKNSHFIVDLKEGTLKAVTKEDMDNIGNASYIKTAADKNTYLWKRRSANKDGYIYDLVKPLGNNGEYLEMSTSDIITPLTDTNISLEDTKESSLVEQSPAETEMQGTDSQVNTKTEKEKKTLELIGLIMKQNPKLTPTEARNRLEDMKKRPRLYAGFIQNIFKHKGLDLNKEEAINEFEKYC